jgi:hypothetical protein
MNMKNSIGFVAFWKATDTWFTEKEENKEKFMADLEEIFQSARDKGVVMNGIFDCSWSSEWRYFTFWECPSIEVLEETCKQLTIIGDINKYNIQRHFVGRRVEEELLQ